MKVVFLAIFSLHIWCRACNPARDPRIHNRGPKYWTYSYIYDILNSFANHHTVHSTPIIECTKLHISILVLKYATKMMKLIHRHSSSRPRLLIERMEWAPRPSWSLGPRTVHHLRQNIAKAVSHITARPEQPCSYSGKRWHLLKTRRWDMDPWHLTTVDYTTFYKDNYRSYGNELYNSDRRTTT